MHKIRKSLAKSNQLFRLEMWNCDVQVAKGVYLHIIILQVHSCTFSENEMKHKLMLLRILQNVKVLSNTGVVNTGFIIWNRLYYTPVCSGTTAAMPSWLRLSKLDI